MRRWLARADQRRPIRPEWYQLVQADRGANAYFRGNVTALSPTAYRRRFRGTLAA